MGHVKAYVNFIHENSRQNTMHLHSQCNSNSNNYIVQMEPTSVQMQKYDVRISGVMKRSLSSFIHFVALEKKLFSCNMKS